MGKTTSLDEARLRAAGTETQGEAKPEGTAKKNRRSLKLFLIGAGAILAALTFMTQGQRMQEIRAEAEDLENRILELKNETQRLERKIQYSQTDAYIEQMALKQFGMVKPGDILFYADASGSLITAPVPEGAPPGEGEDLPEDSDTPEN